MSRNGMEGGEVFDEARKILPAKFDKVFLTLFTNPKYKDIVALPFLRAYLRKPDLKPSDVIISDPRLASDELDEKHPIVDVFITMPTELLHMEMQFFVTKETLDRFFYYHAKAFAGQLKSGESYSKLKKLISLFITTQTAIDDTADENVPERGYYFHSFEVYDKIHNVTMTDKAVINVLELNKIPVKSDGSTEWIWGSLFDAEEEEQFDMLAKAYPEVADAVKVIKELSADQQFRYEAFLAEKAKRDWISSISSAQDEGIEKGKLEGKKEGIRIGEQNARKEMALEMLAEGAYSLEAIARLAKTTVEQVQEWAREAQ